MKTEEKIVAVVSSTGGPGTLQQLLSGLPVNLAAPVLVVQHMPAGFTASLADRLNRNCEIHVKEGEDGERIEKGTVYLSVGGKHLEVKRSRGGSHQIVYQDEPAREGVKPCGNFMYESLIDSGYGEIICVVLTGMGADGTEGIENLKNSKTVYVITQSKETCAVYGMPRAVDMAELTNESVPLDKVAEAIIKNVGVMKDGC